MDKTNEFFFFQAEDGIRDHAQSRGLGDVYKRQIQRHKPISHKKERMKMKSLMYKFKVVLTKSFLRPKNSRDLSEKNTPYQDHKQANYEVIYGCRQIGKGI
eukprot:TRINITY_DN582_c0_g1_i1.p2 TRINITY_DN582_c0_g1~~TRINITY_DN582_c0_g1_i1.p2  ORF type:complete len:101 (-),score=10.82 TRINITY_DN582_c0_g1_i1:213-515(-)